MRVDQSTGRADELSVHGEQELQSAQAAEAVGDKDGQIAQKKAKRRAGKEAIEGADEGDLFGTQGSGLARSRVTDDDSKPLPARKAQKLRQTVTIEEGRDARSQLQRFGNLTFILKLNIVPPAEPQGPPAPILPQRHPATKDTED